MGLPGLSASLPARRLWCVPGRRHPEKTHRLETTRPAPLVRGRQIWVKSNLPSQQPPRQGQQQPGPARIPGLFTGGRK